MKKKIRVLIVDDHAVVRRGLRSLFQIEQDIVVAGEAANGIEAVEAAQSLKPDVVIMDLVMPESCRNSKPPTAPKPSPSPSASVC